MQVTKVDPKFRPRLMLAGRNLPLPKKNIVNADVLMPSRHLLKQRFRIAAIIFVFLDLVYIFLPPINPPDWQNNRNIDRLAPNTQKQTEAEFLYHSRFRAYPDADFEVQLDNALIEIEKAALPPDDRVVKKIWQIWKDEKLSEDREKDRLLWIERNPEWEHVLFTDALANDFVHSTLRTVPSLSRTWRSYALNVLRADLLRYMLLWYHGGFYADIDVYPRVPISACSSLQPLFSPADHSGIRHNISLVVGTEIDEPYASPAMKKAWHWSRTYGFIQYTLFAPRRFSPLLRKVIVRALAHSARHNELEWRWWRRVRYSEEDILGVTGPGMFTDGLLDVLSDTLPKSHPLVEASLEASSETQPTPDELERHAPYSKSEKGHTTTWAPFHNLTKPLWIDGSEVESGRDAMGGLVVLPISVWGNGQRHSGADGFDSVHACVNHRFERTWKKGWWEYLVG